MKFTSILLSAAIIAIVSTTESVYYRRFYRRDHESTNSASPESTYSTASTTTREYPDSTSASQQANCTDGEMKCEGTGFNTCFQNSWIYRDCAEGTMCSMDAYDHLVCGWPKNMNATRCENEDGMKHYNGTMNNTSMSDSKKDQEDSKYSNENDFSTKDCQEQMQHSNGTKHTAMKSDNESD